MMWCGQQEGRRKQTGLSQNGGMCQPALISRGLTASQREASVSGAAGCRALLRNTVTWRQCVLVLAMQSRVLLVNRVARPSPGVLPSLTPFNRWEGRGSSGTRAPSCGEQNQGPGRRAHTADSAALGGLAGQLRHEG